MKYTEEELLLGLRPEPPPPPLAPQCAIRGRAPTPLFHLWGKMRHIPPFFPAGGHVGPSELPWKLR